MKAGRTKGSEANSLGERIEHQPDQKYQPIKLEGILTNEGG